MEDKLSKQVDKSTKLACNDTLLICGQRRQLLLKLTVSSSPGDLNENEVFDLTEILAGQAGQTIIFWLIQFSQLRVVNSSLNGSL